MRAIKLVSLMLMVSFLMVGCVMPFEPIDTDDEEIVIEDPSPYIDAYVDIPEEVKDLIAYNVDGYSMPPVARYGYTLYPTDVITDRQNLPSYVKADFNGDGYSDYAYMFSKVYYSGGDWYLKTKMLIVVSTSYSYKISTELDLGTITNSQSTPVEEYWAIRLLQKGTHKVTTYKNGDEKETTVELKNDGIYLASIDPQERSVFYVDGTESHEIILDLGSIAKKPVSPSRSERVISLKSPSLTSR
jgi:hypothetical protein